MINKSMTCLQSRKNILLIFGITTVALLVSTSSSQMISASVEGSSPGSNASNLSQEVADHINEAKSALQNGDTEGAQRHLDLAHQALGCGYYDPRCASE